MTYTIGEVAEKLNLSTHTLRYYDKEGLLPFVDRTDSGIRQFKESDLDWLIIIECLKASGMSLKEIKLFIALCLESDTSLQMRYDMFMERREKLIEQMAALQNTLDIIDYQCWYYQTSIEAGSTEVHTEKPGYRPPEFNPLEFEQQLHQSEPTA